MECKIIQKHLSDYQLGRLDRQLQQWVEHHLATCAECRSLLKDEQMVSQFLNSAEKVDSPESIAPLLMKKLQDIDQKKRIDFYSIRMKPTPKIRMLLIVSMVLLFTIIGFSVFYFHQETKSYFTSYGKTGFTLIGEPFPGLGDAGDSELKLSAPAGAGGSLAVIAGSDASEATPESNRVFHTFDLSGTPAGIKENGSRQEEHK
jgi:hypothetical protein